MLQSMRSSAKYIWFIIVFAFVGVFIFAQTSGLTDRNVTRGTTVGKVNGEPISVDEFDRAVRNLSEQAQRQGGSSSMDDQHRYEQMAFDQLVDDVLLREELRRRGIGVSDAEIQQAAASYPPPEILRAPDLQTEGKFDPEKYQRYLRSPGARQSGILQYLEGYYRSEIPKQKLAEQLVTGVYVSDAQLWNLWQNDHDSAQVSYVSLTPESVPDSTVKVSDAEVRSYFDRNAKQFGEQPGRAVISLISLPRPVTAADSAAVRARLLALRDEIANGAKFEDVAKRESADSVSAERGGDLGRAGPTTFVQEFSKAAYALTPGQLSEPVLSPFGYHLIRVDEKKGDTLSVRHILLRIQQSDSSAARTDRRADELAQLAAESEQPARFDSAARSLGLPVTRVTAFEGEATSLAGRPVPDVSGWAFRGARVGETSPLISADDAYYLARLDSIVPGGKPGFAQIREDLRQIVLREKKVDALAPRARALASAVARGSTLEQAAQANGLRVEQTPMFTRASPVSGLGRLNEAVGAAFALPVGAISEPIKTRTGVFILRVERRQLADQAAWEAQKQVQRTALTGRLREQRVQQFMSNLREEAKIVDDRRKIRSLRSEPTASS
ncbi:MAG: peptidyl-prolyl cis-trans isomerase [Gemmatimonadaceae bacterium]